ncbi:hypothetical protein PT974_08564 [Cladobotryum mycophilum]|uniref:F-box domain-containing protein n=1 Tax=Cladobotryum mycophilum TaxID=491253 RepID=A0ABR0SDP0_9HYPO
MSSKSWYVLKSKAVPTRYGLSKNIQGLLQSLENYHSGAIDDAELGRLVRLSPNRRAAIANTITKCAGIIKKQPDELKTCLDIIEMCTEILEVADKRPSTEGFPFMRLPVEIRDRIMCLMIDNVFRTKTIVPVMKKSVCRCPKFDRDPTWQNPQMKALPSLLGPALSYEFFRIFFRKKKFRFRCTCELNSHLTKNEQLRNNVQHIMVHWCGPESVNAFQTIAKCPRLENLTITISKTTFAYLSERASLMKSYFPLLFRNPRITDVLGLDELLDIRGLKEVDVTRAYSSGGGTLSIETDRANLSELLSSKLTQPKDDDE